METDVTVAFEDWDGDAAPAGGADDCTGEGDDDEALEGVVPGAADRGWGPGWPRCQTDRLVTVRVGAAVRLAVRREIAPVVAHLCAETVRRGYPLRSGQCWGFACRAIRGSSVASNHSWGLAVDLNSLANPMGGRLVTDMPGWMPALWREHGFRWGGTYAGRKDAMHYEYVGTPASAAALAGRLDVAPAQPARPAQPVTARQPVAAPPFPLPAGHYFGVDPTPDCRTGRAAADRPHVRRLQQRLLDRGWDLDPDGADGYYGTVTKDVVVRFQTEKGLHVDGRVGPTTWAALWQAPVT